MGECKCNLERLTHTYARRHRNASSKGGNRLEELILIRHGEAEHILTGTAGGWTDTKLTERGKFEAEQTGQRLSQLLGDKKFNFYCSDLQRASQTADIIGRILNRTPIVKTALRELNNGIAANKTKDEAKLLRLPKTEPILDWVPFPDGESWTMMYDRVVACMHEIVNDPHPLTILVTHANTAAAIIQWWLELPREVMSRTFFDIEPCSITFLNINSWNEKTITKLNDTCHLGNSELVRR